MARRLAKVIAWVFGGAVALTVAAYAILLVANLSDRPPGAEIAVLESLQDSTPPVASDDNSYIFILGFAGPPEADPWSLGSERYEWLARGGPDFDRADDPLGEDYDFRALRSNAVAQLVTACSQADPGCLTLLESDASPIEQWLADERWLLDRYRALIRLTDFREAVPYGPLAPLPSYNVVFEGQRLHLVDAWRSATRADAATASAALDHDLSYWRMVLEKSDQLITKMIATAAIIRHFKLGNLVLRRLPQAVAADGIPPSWRAQISDAERSMRRSLAGEWMYSDKVVKDMAPGGLLEPFWQPQDLSNRHARLMLDLSSAFDVPYDEIPDAVGLAIDLQESAYRPFSRLYNFAGDLVMASNRGSYSDYAVRVSDPEGIRRAALLVAEIRAAGTSKDEIVQQISVSEHVDPYTNEPFTWIDGEEAIVFDGLESHESRSQHKLIF